MAIQLNTRYPTKTNAPDASYPNGSFRDIIITGDGTGTPYKADIMNDLAGWQQELMDRAGLSENDAIERVGQSQYYDAMQLTAGHPGIVVPGAFTNATPASLGLRLLKLDGSGILIADYADLDAVSWVGATDNPNSDGFFRADNPSGVTRNVAGAYLILPDMRGQFIRGRDPTGTVDPEGTTRVAHEIQDWAQVSHHHNLNYSGAGGPAYFADFSPSAGAAQKLLQNTDATGDRGHATDLQTTADAAWPGDNEDSDELRPTNMDFDLWVWY